MEIRDDNHLLYLKTRMKSDSTKQQYRASLASFRISATL